jgi:hypothetical protein
MLGFPDGCAAVGAAMGEAQVGTDVPQRAQRDFRLRRRRRAASVSSLVGDDDRVSIVHDG